MKTRPLGRNGAPVGAIGYGAMSFSDFYGPTTDAASMRILDACLELGITHIDTSDVYGKGRSETVIGEWLAARGGASPFVLATKGGITGKPERRFRNDKRYLTKSLNASLKRLGVEAVDLYYVHRRQAEREIEEVTETLAGFVKAGKVKAIGFSEISPASLRRAHSVHPVAAVQSEYSLSTRLPELGLKQTCEELGVALVAFSPVGRGLLTDRPPDAKMVRKIPFLKGNPRFMKPNLAENLRLTDAFRALAEDMGTSAATLSVAWLLRQGPHIHPIPGTRSLEHLREVAGAVDLTLSAEDMNRIEEVLPVGWAHGDRYSEAQWIGPERYG
ncbi:MAG: aldo/keto reductase [Pseudomonadota bacterium]